MNSSTTPSFSPGTTNCPSSFFIMAVSGNLSGTAPLLVGPILIPLSRDGVLPDADRCLPVSGWLILPETVAYRIFCPHSGQNFVPEATGFPQLGQGVIACAGGGATNMVAPQLEQNRAPC